MNELDNIVVENQNLIYSITKYFDNYPYKEDLFQVGAIGLINAYKRFDDSLGVKFTTYAYPYILGEMRKCVREDKGIKISRNITKLNLKIEKASILLSQRLMREPTFQELSSFLEIPEYVLEEALRARNSIESMDEPIESEGKDMSLHETLSTKEMDLDTLIALKEELLALDQTDRQIIENRYIQSFTQSETAKILGMSQVQVSRKEQRILERLKTHLTAEY